MKEKANGVNPKLRFRSTGVLLIVIWSNRGTENSISLMKSCRIGCCALIAVLNHSQQNVECAGSALNKCSNKRLVVSASITNPVPAWCFCCCGWNGGCFALRIQNYNDNDHQCHQLWLNILRMDCMYFLNAISYSLITIYISYVVKWINESTCIINVEMVCVTFEWSEND